MKFKKLRQEMGIAFVTFSMVAIIAFVVVRWTT